MKLKDCTKEELIYILERYAYYSSCFDLENIILNKRWEDAQKLVEEQAEIMIHASEQYTQYAQLLVGLRMADIAKDSLNELVKLEEESKKQYEKYTVLQAKQEKAWTALQSYWEGKDIL